MTLLDEDFVGFDPGDVAYAASALTQAMYDVTFHYCVEGMWEPSGDGVVEEIARVRHVIAQVERGLRECRWRLAELERPARGRAAQRQKGQ